MATNVICSVCGKPYLAHSSRSTINYKLRQGKPLYCPDCVKVKNRETCVKNNRRRYYQDIPKEFVAPCRQTIVPAHESATSRCKQGLKAGCPIEHYDVCMDFAAKNGWDGWRIA